MKRQPRNLNFWQTLAIMLGISAIVVGIIFFVLNWDAQFIRPAGANFNEHENGNIEICHATSSNSNPYVENHPNKNGNVSGHDNHNGPIWYDGIDGHWGDIIPSFFYWDFYNPPGPLPLGWYLRHYDGKNWNSQGQAILRNDCDIPKGEEPSVTPEPTGVHVDENLPPSSTETPVCTDGSTVNLPANYFVTRSADFKSLTVNAFITEGDHANIYWGVVGHQRWENAAGDIKPNSEKWISYVVNDLDPNLPYEVGFQQAKGCGTGELVTAIVEDGPQARTFRMTSWSW